jgi:hypothetical protein
MKTAKFKFLPGDEVWAAIDIETDSFEIGHGKVFECITAGNSPDCHYYVVHNFHSKDGFFGDVELEECDVFSLPDEAFEYCLKEMKKMNEENDKIGKDPKVKDLVDKIFKAI